MTTVAILPETPGSPGSSYLAIAGKVRSIGPTAGQALDALTAQLGETASGTLVVVQYMRPDQFFTAAQRQRLEDLMARWRAARDGRAPMRSDDSRELETLVEDELKAAGERAAALARELGA
jgi:hypothetical protein